MPKKLKKYVLQEDDIVIGMDGSKVGKNYALVPKTNIPLLLAQRVDRLRAHKEVMPKFIYYHIINGNFLYHADTVKTDPAVPHISEKDIRDYKISIPDKSEQKDIVEYLDQETDRIHSLIDSEFELIEKLKEYRQSLISAAVTGKIDVRDEVEELEEIRKDELETAILIIMYTIDEYYRRQVYFGRLMVVKTYFLLHYILQLQNIPVSFGRHKNGPYDEEFWELVEDILTQRKWVEIPSSENKDSKIDFIPNRTIDYKEKLEQRLGKDLSKVKNIIGVMARNDSKNSEILATVYAAWNDLIKFDIEPTEDDQFAENYFAKNVKQTKLYSILEPVADRFNELGEDEQRDFYRKLRKYVRTYSFLSQILPFDDVPMEKFYAFGKYLLRLISLEESKLPREVLQEVDMDSYRIQRMYKGQIDLKRGGGELQSSQLDGETSGSEEAEESLSEIIRVINDRYGTDFSEDDKVFTAFRDRLYKDEVVQKSAEANTKENAKITFEDKAREHAREMIDEHFGFYKKFNDDDDFREALVHMLFNDFQSWMQEKGA